MVMDGETIIGCGGITGYWGSTEESYLTSIFILPDYQGKGVGRKIVETLEEDEYFYRAWRTEDNYADANGTITEAMKEVTRFADWMGLKLRLSGRKNNEN